MTRMNIDPSLDSIVQFINIKHYNQQFDQQQMITFTDANKYKNKVRLIIKLLSKVLTFMK